MDFAMKKWAESGLQKRLLEYGRQLGDIDLRRNADGTFSGGLVDIAKVLREEADAAHEDYRMIGMWTGRKSESPVGKVRNYMPHIYGGTGFEPAEHQLARASIHLQARQRGKWTGEGSELPSSSFQAKFSDKVKDAAAEP